MRHHGAWVRQYMRFYAPSSVPKKQEILSAGSRRFPDRLGDMDMYLVLKRLVMCILAVFVALEATPQ